VFFLALAISPTLRSYANYPSFGGNDNYLFYGSSKTGHIAIDSSFAFNSALAPNKFSTQVNTFITTTCNGNSAKLINYQDVVRTGANGVNQFSMDFGNCTGVTNYAFNILTNYDLSASGVVLEYWFNYNSNYQVTSGEVTVQGYGGCPTCQDTFIIYVNQISGGLDQITSEYQHVLVGSANQGGSTTFTAGSGNINYNSQDRGLSNHESETGVYDYTGETSNAAYGSVQFSSWYYQSWTF